MNTVKAGGARELAGSIMGDVIKREMAITSVYQVARLRLRNSGRL